MSDHDTLISEFSQITGTDASNARFFLESAAWNLEIALASFYEAFGSGGDASNDLPAIPEPHRATAGGDMSPAVRTARRDTVGSTVKHGESLKPASNSRLGTIAGIRNVDRENDEREAFYAGGSVHSGQQVLGPEASADDETRRRRDAIANMLRAAAHEHGDDSDDVEPARNQPGAFLGVGYRLGQTSDDSTMIFTTDDGGGSSRDRREVTLKLWKQGFCVEDGPLREYNDPRNLEFLNNIRRGKIPDELLSEACGGTVHLNMEDHRHELYVSPKPKVKAFAGKGHVLGSPTPSISTGSANPTVSSPLDQREESGLESESNQAIEVDSQSPTTNIQVRLADGSRLHIRLNHTHIIGDIRRYIASARPEYAGAEYTLLTTFPSRELNDDNATLHEAGILNSAILQRMK